MIAGGDAELLLFEVREPEGVVLPERAAGTGAPLLVAQGRVAGLKRRDDGKRLVAVVVVSRAVDLVCT